MNVLFDALAAGAQRTVLIRPDDTQVTGLAPRVGQITNVLQDAGSNLVTVLQCQAKNRSRLWRFMWFCVLDRCFCP